jgi:hypothetical protein
MAMKLSVLEPYFLKLGWQSEEERFAEGRAKPARLYLKVDKIEDAQGVEFLCPVCFIANKGVVGTHGVICWSKSRGVPGDEDPKPGRWTLEGNSLGNLTLGCEPGKSRSVLLLGDGCKAHFFVTNGEVQLA